MQTMKGPGIFLAQFAGDDAPFNDFKAICAWAAGHGYRGVQVPTWDGRLFDLAKAAESKTYCDEISGIAREAGVEITDLSSSSPSIQPSTRPLTALRHRTCAAIPKPGRNGPSIS